MLPDKDEPRFALSEALKEELEAVKREPLVASDDNGNAVSLSELFAARSIREGSEDAREANEALRRRRLYNAAHRHNLSALCLSGGGIRSASFALGVIQGLTDKALLQKFDYLSTVSGGGYIGSWLSAWLRHSGSDEVLDGLCSRRTDADREPSAIRHLREYSSFLTPKVGVVSADTWAALAILLRNMLLNWLILVPALCLPVILVKLVAAIAHTAHFGMCLLVSIVAALLWALLVALSVGYKLHRLYFVRDIQPAAREQKLFLWLSVVPAIIAGASAAWLANATENDPVLLWTGLTANAGPAASRWQLAVIPIAGAIIYGVTALGIRLRAAHEAARRAASSPPGSEPRPPDKEPTSNIVKDILSWTVAGIVCGILVWLGALLYRHMHPLWLGELCDKGAGTCTQLTLDPQVLLIIFGMPWLLVAMRVGQMFYIVLRSYSPAGDFEREWLGRAGGWHLIAALAWVVLSGLVFLGTELYEYWQHPNWMVLLGGLSGLAVRFLGKSSQTGGAGGATDWKGIAANVGLAIAGPLFAAILIMLLSMAFDWIVVQGAFSRSAMFADGKSYGWEWTKTAILILVLLVVMFTADYLINVNRFSLHALYRNRLIRAFLGAGRGRDRRPDGFTGFDQNDNFRVSELWPTIEPAKDAWQPFHVINITLNLASSKHLAWQQRKGMSFPVTPLHCGTAELGFRRTADYGNPNDHGISLGTAMAISGAAVSPNMGYHSSPSIAFLLTLFNVRLGWWLGNPGQAGASTYMRDAPGFALFPLVAELFGLTHEDNPYVFLSDGGHFENLGLYEMVRRRCKWIVVVDGGQDADRGFFDLGDAVRKVWIDLGVRITFEGSQLLRADKETKSSDVPYFAVGTVEYASDDPIAPAQTPPQGHILYIKPTVRGDEWAADIIAYKRANNEFPHQSTGDQWFDEPQLEGYRALGYLIIKRLTTAANASGDLAALFTGLAAIDSQTLEPKRAPVRRSSTPRVGRNP